MEKRILLVVAVVVAAGCTPPETDGSKETTTVDSNTGTDGGGDADSNGATDSDGSNDSGLDTDSGDTTDTSWKETSGVPYLDIAVGGSQCALRADHHLACWGSDSGGVITYLPNQTAAALIPGVSPCAVGEDGIPFCWGYDYDFAGLFDPPQIALTEVTGDSTWACGVDGADEVNCWGVSGDFVPGETYSTLCVGGSTVCGLTPEKSIRCLTYGVSWAPEHPLNAEFGGVEADVTALACTDTSLCAVRTDGRVTCWGEDPAGAFPPADVKVTQLIAGADAYCGLLTDQTISCWGTGPIATGDSIHGGVTPETEVPSGAFTHIDTSGTQACGIRVEGTLACWAYADGTPPE